MKLKNTGLDVYPLCLGGNVFGWTADEATSFEVLDAFFEAGGNFIDTADVYSEWAPGNKGGESESIIGNWMSSRGVREKMVIATKVAKLSSRPGLSAANIKLAIEDSLSRLKTDYLDLYWAHEDDSSVPLEETLGAFSELLDEGKIRAIGASNYTPDRILEAHELSTQYSLKSFSAIQNEYSLVVRRKYEGTFLNNAPALLLDQIPYFSLARGFLTGKYAPGETPNSVRAESVSQFMTDEGWKLIREIEVLARKHETSCAAISLAWLRGKGVLPIASARTVAQLREIMPIIELTEDELDFLSSLSASF